MASDPLGRLGFQPASSPQPDGSREVDWTSFERLVGQYFRERGYEVECCPTCGVSPRVEEGAGLSLQRGAERVVVQCKQHAVPAPRASRPAVIESARIAPARIAPAGAPSASGSLSRLRRQNEHVDRLRAERASRPPAQLPAPPAEVAVQALRPQSRARRPKPDPERLLVKFVAGVLLTLTATVGSAALIRRAPPLPQASVSAVTAFGGAPTLGRVAPQPAGIAARSLAASWLP